MKAHVTYLYRLGLSFNEIYRLQDAYLDYLGGKRENYLALIGKYKDKGFSRTEWEKSVDEASPGASVRPFTRKFLMYASRPSKGGKLGAFISDKVDLGFYPKTAKSNVTAMKIGKLVWDLNEIPPKDELQKALKIINKFLKTNNLETISSDELPLGIQGVHLLAATLVKIANKGPSFNVGILKDRIYAFINVDISGVLNRAIPEGGEDLSLNETIEFIRNILIRQEESGKIPKDYLDILTNIFNPNVIKQLDPELTAAIDEFLSKQFRGKPLSYWLVRVVRKDKNVRQMTVPVELTTEIETPVGFGRPTVEDSGKDDKPYSIGKRPPSIFTGQGMTKNTGEVVIELFIRPQLPNVTKTLEKKARSAESKINTYELDKLKNKLARDISPEVKEKTEERIKLLEEKVMQGKEEIRELKPLVKKYNDSVQDLINLAEKTFKMKIKGEKRGNVLKLITDFKVTNKGSLTIEEVRDIISDTLKKMDVEDLPPKTRKKVKTYMQDADPTEYFGEEYLKLGKVINILEGIVEAEDEEELAELSEDNLKLVKLAARLRRHYETLYRALDDMVYDNKEEEE
jgi:hypothetical protein